MYTSTDSDIDQSCMEYAPVLVRYPLTGNQRRRVDAARAVLNARQDGYDLHAMAVHVGRLKFWLGDILALVGQLAGEDAGQTA